MIDPENVPLEEKIKTIRIVRKMVENMLSAVVRPEHGETMRRLQRVELETQRLREAGAKPKSKAAPRPDDLVEAIANIGSQPAVEAQPEPAEEPPYTVEDAIRELRAADRGRR